MFKTLVVYFSFVSLTYAHSLLPDLKTATYPLRDYKIDRTTIPGVRLLRFSNGVANIGKGRLEIRAGRIYDGVQSVYQRIYNTQGGYSTRYAGSFEYHPEHNHTHFNDFSDYKLRKIISTSGVGSIVARTEKVSFCLIDESVYNSRLTNFRNYRRYRSCGTSVQGISVGWADVYNRSLYGQWIDITDVPEGEYWLESTVDPKNLILESNETNNTTRIRVRIPSPSLIELVESE
jgi:hypothetical protein